MKCLYFLIFILVLQQFDGNILGPKILGILQDSQASGYYFHPVIWWIVWIRGMIIAVPTFAVIYRTMSLYILIALLKKKNSENTSDYCCLHHIDSRSGEFVNMNRWSKEEK